MVKWPRSYWDDWMREPAQRKGLCYAKFHHWLSSTRLGQENPLKEKFNLLLFHQVSSEFFQRHPKHWHAVL